MDLEHTHKLLVTASSQAQGACLESKKDRFSNLPDEVAHQILSFLNFQELISVASVSKRCREFYLSRPVLDFSSANAISKQHNLQLLNYFDRFLFLRGDNKIQHFNIYWNLSSGLSDEIFRLLTWIHIAVRCNVEVLKFNLSSWHMPETLELPFCIFVCQSLRSLFLDVETRRTILKAPSFSCSTNLQDLTLRKVRIDEGFCKWVSSSCKCIKKLQLYNVHIENFTLESSSLESFSFEVEFFSDVCHLNISGEKLLDIHIHWAFDKHSSSSRSLNIFAPNLKYFKWVGNLLNHQHLGKLMCLKKAQILLKRKADDYDFDFDKAYEILCSISRVKVLILTEDSTKALCREGSMPAPFNDISSLSMHIGSLNDDLVPAMVSLLRGMPNLKTLRINTYPYLLLDKPKACRFNRKYWQSQNLDFVYQLKVVKIELSHGYNAWELARYILEHAQNLEKMVIYYLPKQSYVMRKVNKCKIISKATVIFREKVSENTIRLDMCRYLHAFRNHP